MRLGRASQHLRFHNCLLSFFFLFKFEVCSSWRVPVWTTTSYYKRDTFSFIALREVPFVRGLFYVKCTLPVTRRTDNFVVIMASSHPSLVMLYNHLLVLWASYMGCTWIESCVVVFAVLRLSRSFYVTLPRGWHFWTNMWAITFGA